MNERPRSTIRTKRLNGDYVGEVGRVISVGVLAVVADAAEAAGKDAKQEAVGDWV